MLDFLIKLLHRKKKVDPSDVAEEVWVPGFKNPKRERFVEEDTKAVRIRVGGGTLSLVLKKKNLFGWAENPLYRYRDFVIEASIDVSAHNGHSAAGFLMRRADELNYYFFLVSPAGFFRFDVVFNGNPRTLIPWTACTPRPDNIMMRIIARGSYFGFFLDEDWIGEIEDDTIDAGNITFAAQNYDETDTARFDLSRLKINSLPYEVEAQYYRWRRYIPVNPERRVVLARSLASRGRFPAACIQFNLAAKELELGLEDLLILSECYLQNSMVEEAARTIDKALAVDGENPATLTAKADLLYRRNRIIELRDFLAQHPVILKDNGVMWNLYGNAWHILGNREEAAHAYEMACEIDPETSIYRINAARMWESMGETEKALDDYLKAARLLFREEGYAELSGILPQIERLDAGNLEALAIRGKLAFSEGQFEEAEKAFDTALAGKSDDSSLHYLYGMLLAQRGEREKAAGYFEKATELEPDYYLYWFRRAENEHLLNQSPQASLERALELAPDDKWVLNLAGLVELEHERNPRALGLLSRAYSQVKKDGEILDPDNEDIYINYAEALCRSGNASEAVSLLSPGRDRPAIINQIGNIFSRQGDYEEAVNAYERAIRLDPDNRDLRLNCAAACIEADRILRAEEILGSLLDSREDASAYNLMGNAAQIKGELKRAEAAYLRALTIDRGHEEAAVNLADLQVRLGKFEEANGTIHTYLSESSHPRLGALIDKVKKETEVEICCAACGRKWTSAKETEAGARLKIRGELPDEAPAGMCPACGNVYCVGCAKTSLNKGRFFCLDCEEPLRLLTDPLKVIVSRYVE
ncbi:MAG: tetratricopeptide repeat protein [Spirochaetales bacterium]|nr:tetratricopeptide repeat protein [Spirochaetales bacterium]